MEEPPMSLELLQVSSEAQELLSDPHMLEVLPMSEDQSLDRHMLVARLSEEPLSLEDSDHQELLEQPLELPLLEPPPPTTPQVLPLL